MEPTDFVQYDYTKSDSPQSDRLVINLDASGDACAVNVMQTTASTGALPSFDTFGSNAPQQHASGWYKLSTENDLTETNNVEQPQVQAHSSGIEKHASPERSFHMDSILGFDQRCEAPLHSTPKTSPTVSRTYQPVQPMIGTTIVPSTENQLNQQTTCTRYVLYSSQNAPANRATKKVYKRNSEKPPYTYVSMALVAILSSEKKELTLADIREKLKDMFPFFRGEYTGWKNSVRQVLSTKKCFYKEERGVKQGTRSTETVWKVNTAFIKPDSFLRTGGATEGNSVYKLTIQEELGLPPTFGFEHLPTSVYKGDIRLPRKPCFQPESSHLVGGDDDFLNGRNDAVPTPLSTLSDIEPPTKRRRTEEPLNIQPMGNQHRMTSTCTLNDLYYNSNVYPDVRSYDPLYNFYQTSAPIGQQTSRDLYYYGNEQQWNWSNENDNMSSLRRWGLRESMYNGMGNSYQPVHYTNITSWLHSLHSAGDAPLNLTKLAEDS